MDHNLFVSFSVVDKKKQKFILKLDFFFLSGNRNRINVTKF